METGSKNEETGRIKEETGRKKEETGRIFLKRVEKVEMG